MVQRKVVATLKFDKKRLMREIERDRRAKIKLRLKELKQKISEARAERRAAIAAVRVDCRLKREELRSACGLRRQRAKEQGEAEVARRARELAEEQGAERLTRLHDKPKRIRKTASSVVRRQEDDDAVRNNLDPEMRGVWDTVKKHIKGSAYRSRTEQFLEWAQENPGEVLDLQMRKADRELQKLLAEQHQHTRTLRKRRVAAADLSDIPF